MHFNQFTLLFKIFRRNVNIPAIKYEYSIRNDFFWTAKPSVFSAKPSNDILVVKIFSEKRNAK